MRTREMSRLMNSAAKLTSAQRAVLLLHLQVRDEGDRAASVVQQRQPDRPGRPKCGATRVVRPGWCDPGGAQRVVRNGQADGLQRCKCRGCSVTFNALTGTPWARLRHRQRWLAQCQALQEGLSVRKVAAQLGVHRTAALRWRHRFLQCPAKIKVLAMRGVVEADGTYVLESFKVQRQALALAQRPSRRRGGKARKRGLSSKQIPILVLRARTGQTADFLIPTAPVHGANKAIKAMMASAVADDAVLCTDGSSLLASAARALDIEHQPVNLSKGQRVCGAWYVQNVNAYASRLKQWLRRFNGVASSYLANDQGWFRALDGRGASTQDSAWLLTLAVKV